MTTKERILEEALQLFSLYGYEAVGVEEIAAAVGIKAPSLYKHYKGKQDIFEAIFAKMQQRYNAQTEHMQLHIENGGKDRDKFAIMDVEGPVKELKELIAYSLHDPYVSRFRRLMTREQFRSPELAALYTQRYVERLVGYHEKLFTELMAAGIIYRGDAHSLALQYTCPVLILLSVCDRQPDREDEVMRQLEAHVRQFFASTHIEKQGEEAR